MRTDESLTTEVLDSVQRQGALSSRTVTLVVASGPDAGKRIEIDDLAHRQVLVGKSAACEVRLSDPTVSRRHAMLELEDNGVSLRDLGSSNLTLVNGVVVREGLLKGGETIKLGATELRLEIDSASRPVASSDEGQFGRFLGAAPVVRRLYAKLERLATLDVPVLFEGEAGTGKELLAEAMHERSARKAGPFIPFENTGDGGRSAELELFGDGTSPSLLDRAKGGTLYIDEVATLPPPTQVKLARVIETGTYRVPGSANVVPLDVRIVAATRRDLDREVQDGRCRAELADLLGAGRVAVPPLRRRPSDIPLLTRFFWVRFGGDASSIPQSLIEEFQRRTWSANTRDLAAATAAFLAKRSFDEPSEGAERPAAEGGEPSADYLAHVIKQELPYAEARELVTAAFERQYLKHMLEAASGNVSEAARNAGISRRYFYRLRSGR